MVSVFGEDSWPTSRSSASEYQQHCQVREVLQSYLESFRNLIGSQRHEVQESDEGEQVHLSSSDAYQRKYDLSAGCEPIPQFYDERGVGSRIEHLLGLLEEDHCLPCHLLFFTACMDLDRQICAFLLQVLHS